MRSARTGWKDSPRRETTVAHARCRRRRLTMHVPRASWSASRPWWSASASPMRSMRKRWSPRPLARAAPFRGHAAPDDPGDELAVVVRPVPVHLPAEHRQRRRAIVGPLPRFPGDGTAAMAGMRRVGYFVVAARLRDGPPRPRRETAPSAATTPPWSIGLGNIATVLTLRLQEPMRRLLRSPASSEVFAPLRRNIVFNEVKWCGIDLLNGGHAHRPGCSLRLAGLPASAGRSASDAVMVHQYSQQVGNVVANRRCIERTSCARRPRSPTWTRSSRVPRVPARRTGRAGRSWREIRVEGVRFVHPRAAAGRTRAGDVVAGLPPRTADRTDRRERRGEELAASRPRRTGRRRAHLISVDGAPHPHT